MHMRRKYVTHACMKAHISEHVYGEKPYMSKRKLRRSAFANVVLNIQNHAHVSRETWKKVAQNSILG